MDSHQQTSLQQSTAAFLLLNGIALTGLGIWCGIDPIRTADLIGLSLNGPKGIAEYRSVYGGIEVGLGIFFLIAWYHQAQRHTGLILGLVLYTSIVLFRGGSMLVDGPTSDYGWVLYSLEVGCFLWSGILMYRASNAAFLRKDSNEIA